MAALVAYKGTVNPALALGQAFVRSRFGIIIIIAGLHNDFIKCLGGFLMSGFSGWARCWEVFPQLYVR